MRFEPIRPLSGILISAFEWMITLSFVVSVFFLGKIHGNDICNFITGWFNLITKGAL